MYRKLLLVATLALVLGGCNRLDQHQPLTTEIERVDLGSSLEETFLSRRSNLNIVSICIRNPDRLLVPIKFELWEKGIAQPVRTLDFSSGNIDATDCTRLQFEPLPTSENQTYTAKLQIGLLSLPPRTPQFLTIEKHAGHLHYKTFYKQDLSSIIHESLFALPGRLKADWIFLAFWGATCGFIMWRLWCRP